MVWHKELEFRLGGCLGGRSGRPCQAGETPPIIIIVQSISSLLYKMVSDWG